jgi:hypothetical protein
MKNEEILKRISELEMQRKPVEGTWGDIERYILPLSGQFFSPVIGEGGKDWSTREVWDSTAPIGAARLASFLWASLCAPTLRWLDVTFPVARVNQDPKGKAWLQDTTDRVYDTFTASNFALEMASEMLDMVGYGNACLTQEPVDPEEWKGYEFAGVPLREMFFEEDYRGRVYRFFRKLSWKPAQIVSKFTDKKTGEVKVPKRVQDLMKGSGADVPLEVVYCIYPRPDKKPMAFGEKVRAAGERPFGYKYVLRTGGETLGDEGGYYEMPAYVGRYDRAVGSQWGFGPGLLALPTVKLANALQEEIVLAAGKVVDPPFLVEERGLLGDVDLERGGMTTVRDTQRSLVPFESKARFDVSDSLLERQQMMIRKFFREDDIGLKASPASTATEVMQRVNLMNRLFGGPVGRTQNDIFDPAVQTTFDGMYRAGKIDKIPDIILEEASKGYGMKIEYRGPFSRAMRDDEVVAIERLMAAAAGAIKMGFEDVKDDFDPAQALREIAERLSTPARMFRSKEEAKASRENRQKLQQMAAKAQIGKTMAEANRAQAGAAEMGGGDMMGGGMQGGEA